MFVYACDSFVTHEDLQIFFSLSFTETVFLRRFAEFEMSGVLIPIHQLLVLKSPKLLPLLPLQTSLS